MIPQGIVSLERFFGSLTLVESPASTESSFQLVPATFFSDGHRMGAEKPLFAAYDPSPGVTPEAALHRIAKELESAGHLASESVVQAFFALYILAERPPNTALARLNDLLASISDAEVSQYLIAPFPAFPGLQSFVIEDFKIGPLEHDRLVYWCERVHCDYFQRYPGRHRGRFAIQRLPLPLKLLDIAAYRRKVAQQVATTLVDYYFHAVSQTLLSQFRIDAWAAQEILIAAGAPFVDLNEPRQWHGGEFIGIYRNIGTAQAGYFCPLAHGLSIDFARIDERVPAVQEKLKSDYDFVRTDSHEIGQTLRTFCRFVARGKLHESQSRVSEAFLHHVIALDLLFGDRDSVIQAVARRTAVCVYDDFGGSFQEALKRVKVLYDARSRYVHAGAQVLPENLESIQALCRSVLQCLLRLHRLPPNNPEEQTIAWWHRQLDYIASALEAEREPTKSDLVRLGLQSDSP